MYCKKCGTRQEEGYKYCHKCGTPLIDESQLQSSAMTAKERGWAIYLIGKAGEQVTEERIRYYVQRQREEAMQQKGQGNSIDDNSQIQSPILNGVDDNSYQTHIETNSQSIMDVEEPMVENTTKQSEQHFGKDEQPSVNFEDSNNKDSGMVEKESIKERDGFFSNINKLRKATLVIAVLSVLWFFCINDGFSASWAWWVVAIMVVGAAFLKVNSLKETRELLAATLFLGICLVFFSPSESDSSSSHLIDDDTEIVEDSESANSVPESEIRFSNDINVITYLTSREFRDSKGNTLRFSGGNCEVEMNYVSISPYTEILSITSNSATLRMHGPYGNATLRLYISGSKGVIQDRDGSEYYSTR